MLSGSATGWPGTEAPNIPSSGQIVVPCSSDTNPSDGPLIDCAATPKLQRAIRRTIPVHVRATRIPYPPWRQFIAEPRPTNSGRQLEARWYCRLAEVVKMGSLHHL